MKRRSEHLMFFLSVMALFLITGCSGIQKRAPHSDWTGFASPELSRNDYVIMDKVEGKSNTQSFLLGLIKVIDEDKLQLLGIKFFEDKYAYQQIETFPLFFFLNDRTGDRAYYKALAKVPDADAILRRRITIEKTGIPILYSSKTVTCAGKTIKIKTDSEL